MSAPAQIGKAEMEAFLAAKEWLTIPDDEQYVTNFAYADYRGLKKLTLGTGVKEIKNGAFYNCESLSEVALGGNKYFAVREDCLVHKRTKRLALCWGRPRIPDGVEKVNMTCFLQPAPVDLFSIGKDLKEIERAMRKFSIGQIALHPHNAFFVLREGCLFAKDSDTMILGCESGVIPEGTQCVGPYAFSNCRVERVVVPSGVKRIEFCAFSGSTLREVVLPDGLERIEQYAFADCPALEAVELPAGLKFYYRESFDTRRVRIKKRRRD